jgi:hypothetical protein
VSKRSRRNVLRVFRELAEDQGNVFPPRARWRPIVRLLRQRYGWRFADAFLWTMYGGGRMMKLMESMYGVTPMHTKPDPERFKPEPFTFHGQGA